MGRGLDGFLFVMLGVACPVRGTGCAVLKDRGGVVSHRFPVAMARGKHLFPFRTEQLSPSAPMVLGSQGPGRVGRRRFVIQRPRSTSSGAVSSWGGVSLLAGREAGGGGPPDRSGLG